jgi:hypothetical protein
MWPFWIEAVSCGYPIAFVVADVRHRADELAYAVGCGVDVSAAGEQDRGAVVGLEHASEVRAERARRLGALESWPLAASQ